MVLPERMKPQTGDVKQDTAEIIRYLLYMTERIEMAFSNAQKENRELRERIEQMTERIEQLEGS